MKVFVTGGTGVLGQPTVRLLTARGHTVTALARNAERAALLTEMGATPRVGDLFDAAFIRNAMGDAEAVLHLATAIPKKSSPGSADWLVNDQIRREGTTNILAAARAQPRRSVVLQSLAYLYGDTRGEWRREDDPVPDKLWKVLQSAVDMERVALADYKAHATPIVILRGAQFYGPTAWNTRTMLDAIKHRRFPIIGSGEQYWHWVYVDDMARACVLAAEHPAPGEIFNVADDWAFHARDGVNYMATQLNAPAPFKMSTLLARVLGGESTALLAHSARYRTDKIKKMLGWAPKYPTYREGLAEILRPLGKRV